MTDTLVVIHEVTICSGSSVLYVGAVLILLSWFLCAGIKSKGD